MVREWGTGAGADTAQWYLGFAEAVDGESHAYREIARGVAEDPRVLALLEELPPPKRQPNLLLAAARFHGGPVADYPSFRDWVMEHWSGVGATMSRRRTQTNEAARCAALLPLLALLPQPLALIEVGASAGLCLYPDRYRYRYGGAAEIGPAESPVALTCATEGPVPLPAAPPAVVWRAGIDLAPLDVRDPEDIRWLECLVWPGEQEAQRVRRLRGAVHVARQDPPVLVRGDLNEDLAALVARAPAGATPVVFHSAVLAYLDGEERERFVRTVRELGVRWISNEAASVLPAVERRLPSPPADPRAGFVPALDGRPLAFAGQHGQRLSWFAEEPVR